MLYAFLFTLDTVHRVLVAIRQDFQRTQPTITARLAITTSRYTTQPRGTCSANCSIQIPLIYHDARVPRTTAGNATTSTSLESNSRIEDASAPLTLRMAISLPRRRTSSAVYPISHQHDEEHRYGRHQCGIAEHADTVVGIGNLLFIADEVDGLIAEGIGCILVQLPQVCTKGSFKRTCTVPVKC